MNSSESFPKIQTCPTANSSRSNDSLSITMGKDGLQKQKSSREKDERDVMILKLSSENKKMRRQITALRHYINNLEASIGVMVEEKDQQPKQTKQDPPVPRCVQCKDTNIRSSDMLGKRYNKCLACSKVWSNELLEQDDL